MSPLCYSTILDTRRARTHTPIDVSADSCRLARCSFPVDALSTLASSFFTAVMLRVRTHWFKKIVFRSQLQVPGDVVPNRRSTCWTFVPDTQRLQQSWGRFSTEFECFPFRCQNRTTTPSRMASCLTALLAYPIYLMVSPATTSRDPAGEVQSGRRAGADLAATTTATGR